MSTPLKKVEPALGLVDESTRATASNDRVAPSTAGPEAAEGVDELAAAKAKADARAKAEADAKA